MIKYGIYYLLRFYVQIGLFFFYKKIEVHGRANIPKDKAILFLPNHQNAFIDALLLVAKNRCITHFVARADIFKRKFLKWLLSLINLMPIYRIRDGWQALGKNQAVFEACHHVLDKNEALMMFPEGNHDTRRRLRPLSKGFTRVVFGSLAIDPNKEIYIVPVGINYTNHYSYRSSVSIYFDQPLLASSYYQEKESAKEANVLKDDVATRLKQIITHIENEQHYDETLTRLEELQPNYLDPAKTNKQLETLEHKSKVLPKRTPGIIHQLMYPFAFLNGIVIVLLWKFLSSFIKDRTFTASFKFCFGITIVPVVIVAQSFLVYLLTDHLWAMGYVLLSLLLMPYLARKV